jgi:hypothetical protein
MSPPLDTPATAGSGHRGAAVALSGVAGLAFAIPGV